MKDFWVLDNLVGQRRRFWDITCLKCENKLNNRLIHCENSLLISINENKCWPTSTMSFVFVNDVPFALCLYIFACGTCILLKLYWKAVIMSICNQQILLVIFFAIFFLFCWEPHAGCWGGKNLWMTPRSHGQFNLLPRALKWKRDVPQCTCAAQTDGVCVAEPLSRL